MAACRRAIGLAKAVEDVGQKFGRDALAAIGNFERDALADALRCDAHLALRGREFDGVGKQIPGDLVQAQLIEDLLDVSRIISGNFRLEFGEIDLCGIVQATSQQKGRTCEGTH